MLQVEAKVSCPGRSNFFGPDPQSKSSQCRYISLDLRSDTPMFNPFSKSIRKDLLRVKKWKWWGLKVMIYLWHIDRRRYRKRVTLHQILGTPVTSQCSPKSIIITRIIIIIIIINHTSCTKQYFIIIIVDCLCCS